MRPKPAYMSSGGETDTRERSGGYNMLSASRSPYSSSTIAHRAMCTFSLYLHCHLRSTTMCNTTAIGSNVRGNGTAVSTYDTELLRKTVLPKYACTMQFTLICSDYSTYRRNYTFLWSNKTHLHRDPLCCDIRIRYAQNAVLRRKITEHRISTDVATTHETTSAEINLQQIYTLQQQE